MYAGHKVHYANWVKLWSGERSNIILGEGGATVRDRIIQQAGR